jgi:hypothetical protein
VSDKFVLQNIGSLPALLEAYCDVYDPQFTAELDVVSAFEMSAFSHFSMVLALFMLIGIAQKPMLSSWHPENHLLLSPFSSETYLWKDWRYNNHIYEYF